MDGETPCTEYYTNLQLVIKTKFVFKSSTCTRRYQYYDVSLAKCLSSLDVEELVSLVERPAVQLQVQPVHAPRHPRAQARLTVRSPPVHLADVLVQRIDLVGIGRGDVGDVDCDGRPVQCDRRARRGRIVRHEPVDTFDGGGGGMVR